MRSITIRTATLLLLGAWLCASCGSSNGGNAGTGGAIPKCNGHAELCDRTFDEVAYPMTHNAMSNAEAGWISPNQNFGITRQLSDGVRGMMLDTYEEDGELLLCHVICLAGSQPLVEGLEEITVFLEANPEEVVSIIFETYITHAQTAGAFEDSGLIDFVYAHEVGDRGPRSASSSKPTPASWSFKGRHRKPSSPG